MSEIINFPTKNEPITTEYYSKNTDVIMTFREKVRSEAEAIKALNNPAASDIMFDVGAIIDQMLGIASLRVRGHESDVIDVLGILGNYVKYIETLLSGGILTPITGHEEEWEDIQIPADAPKVLERHFRDNNYNIDFKSVQVNRRYRNIYRFNKDNKYAHRTDLIQFIDAENPKRRVTNNASVRFIKFPYVLEQVIILAKLDENGALLETLDGKTELDLLNTIAFKTANGTIIAAPTVPFYILKKEGIDCNAEVEKLVKG